MAAKEDILEQIVEEYLLHRGYFVRHNLKFRPHKGDTGFNSQQDSNHSDIDVIGIHPLKEGAERVVVVSCKSWQQGFNPRKQIDAVEKNKKLGGREAWKGARELWKKIWADAFVREIEAATGQTEFTYYTAVTHIVGNERHLWEDNEEFRRNLGGNPVKLIELREMLELIAPQLGTTVAGTEVGRTLQLFKAAGLWHSQDAPTLARKRSSRVAK
jgi:hypothetical protein